MVTPRVEAGSVVTVRDGAFIGMSGPAAEDWRGEGKIGVLLTIFGREARIEFEPHQILPSPLPREAEWPDGTTLGRMFENIRCHASERQLRLFAVACCRRIAHLMTERRCAAVIEVATLCGMWDGDPPAPDCLLRAIDAAERFADEIGDADGLRSASRVASTLYFARAESLADWMDETWSPDDQEQLATSGAANAVHLLCVSGGLGYGVPAAASLAAYWALGGIEDAGTDPAEDAAHRALARDIFGRPLHLESIDGRLLTPSVRGLADAIDKEWPPSLLPILADALEDAGCTDEAILTHLRSPGPHVRGCWALDLLLGKG